MITILHFTDEMKNSVNDHSQTGFHFLVRNRFYKGVCGCARACELNFFWISHPPPRSSFLFKYFTSIPPFFPDRMQVLTAH